MHSLSLLARSTSLRALAPFAAVYAAEARTNLLLCELPTVDAAVACLEEPTRTRSGARPQLLRALVSLAQTRPHPLWSSLLLLACRPYLAGLVAAGEGDPGERESLVIDGFLGAVREASVHAASISLELRDRTEKRLAAHAAAEHAWSAGVLTADMDGFASTDTTPACELASESRGPARNGVSNAELLRTFAERGALTDLVEQRFGGATGPERRKTYNLLASRRARLARAARRGRRTA